MITRVPAQSLSPDDLALLQGAFDALRRTTGLEGRLVAVRTPGQDGRSADALIEIAAEGKRHGYVAVLKRVDRFATLGLIKHQLERYDAPGLLVAPHITPGIAEHCRALDLPFIDTAGNAYLHAPGLLIFVQGQRHRSEEVLHTDTMRGVGATTAPYVAHPPISTTTPRSGTATALRVIFVLLCRQELLNASYREIVRAAGVALGAVGGIFDDLQKRGYITGGVRQGARRFLEPQRLLEEWVMTYPLKLRPKLYPKRFRAAAYDWWRHADVTAYNAQWGGEVAAEKLTGYLKPETMTLYMRPAKAREHIARLVATHRLRADPTGDIEVLDTFWDLPADPEHPDVVPPLLAYADLLATHDPRNLDTARLLYESKITYAVRST